MDRARTLLAQLRAEHAMRRVEKEDAEQKLCAALRVAHYMQLNVERAGIEFKAAQARVGEMRSQLRATGLLYTSNR